MLKRLTLCLMLLYLYLHQPIPQRLSDAVISVPTPAHTTKVVWCCYICTYTSPYHKGCLMLLYLYLHQPIPQRLSDAVISVPTPAYTIKVNTVSDAVISVPTPAHTTKVVWCCYICTYTSPYHKGCLMLLYLYLHQPIPQRLSDAVISVPTPAYTTKFNTVSDAVISVPTPAYTTKVVWCCYICTYTSLYHKGCLMLLYLYLHQPIPQMLSDAVISVPTPAYTKKVNTVSDAVISVPTPAHTTKVVWCCYICIYTSLYQKG